MVINKNYIFLAFISILLQSCREDCDPVSINSLNATFQLFLEKREYKVGDTIRFISEIPKSVVFPEGLVASRVEISSQISCGQLTKSSLGYKEAAANKFIHSIIKGFQYPLTHKDSMDLLDWNLANFIYEEIDGSYVAEIITIPKDTGTFVFSPFTGGIKLNKGSENCEVFNTFRVFYHNGNTNIDILESYDMNHYNEIEKRNHYTFIVKPK